MTRSFHINIGILKKKLSIHQHTILMYTEFLFVLRRFKVWGCSRPTSACADRRLTLAGKMQILLVAIGVGALILGGGLPVVSCGSFLGPWVDLCWWVFVA